MVRTYFDPKTGNLRVELSSGLGPSVVVNEDDDPFVPSYKTKGDGFSAPVTNNIYQALESVGDKPSLKDFYRKGEDKPKGVRYRYEKRDIGNGPELVAVPKAPLVDEEQRARIEQDISKSPNDTIRFGYDADKGDTYTGLAPKDEGPKEAVALDIEDPGLVQMALVPVFSVNLLNHTSTGLSFKTSTELSFKARRLQIARDKLGLEWAKAKSEGRYEDEFKISRDIISRDKEIEQINSQIKIPDVSDIYVPPSSDGIGGILDSGLSTGANLFQWSANTIASMAADMEDASSEMAGGAMGGAAAGTAIPILGTVTGGLTGAGAALVANNAQNNTARNLANQAKDSIGGYQNILGEGGANVSMDPAWTRATLAGYAEASLDLAGFGLLKEGVTSLIAKGADAPFVRKTLGRVLGLGAVMTGNGLVEAGQNWWEQYGGGVRSDFLSPIETPVGRKELLSNFLAGAIFPLAPGALGIAAKTGHEMFKGVFKTEPKLKETSEKVKPKAKAKTETPTDIEESLFSDDEDVSTQETPKAPTLEPKDREPAKEPEPKVSPETNAETLLPDDPRLKEQEDQWRNQLENIRKDLSGVQNNIAVDEYNKVLNNGLEAIDAETFDIETPKTVEGLYAETTDNKLAPSTKVNPDLQSALAKSVDQTRKYQEFLVQPDLIDLRKEAVAESKADKERSRKAAAVSSYYGIPEETVHTFPSKDLDKMYENVPSIKVHHGSSFDFDEFSSDSIGSGEGAQTYGHGLYFAENPDVAERYKENSEEAMSIPVDVLRKYFKEGDVIEGTYGRDKVIKFDSNEKGRWQVTVQEIDKNGEAIGPKRTHATPPSLRDIENKLGKQELGTLYEAEIKGAKDQFLDWDAPFNEQSPIVQKAIDTFESEYNAMAILGDKGRDWYYTIAYKLGNPESASKWLNKHGVKGVIYWDGDSRKTKDGTKNIVNFDDRLVRITSKNGKPFEAQAKAVDTSISESKIGKPSPVPEIQDHVEKDPLTLPDFPKDVSPVQQNGSIYNPNAVWYEEPIDRSIPEVDAVANDLYRIFDKIANRLAGLTKTLKADVVSKMYAKDKNTGAFLGNAGGALVQYANGDRVVRLVMGAANEIKSIIDSGKVAKYVTYSIDRIETILHEIAHVIDMEGLLSDPARNQFMKEKEKLRKKLMASKIIDPDVMKSIEDKEVFAYGFQDWVKNSNDPEAKDLRKFIGGLVAPAGKTLSFWKDIEDNKSLPITRRMYRALADVIKQIFEYIKGKPNSFFRELARGDFADRTDPIQQLMNVQYQRLSAQQVNHQSDVVINDLNNPWESTFRDVMERNQTTANNRPLNLDELGDIIRKDPFHGYTNRFWAWVGALKSLRSAALKDPSAALVYNLIQSRENDTSRYLGSYQKIAKQIMNVPNIDKIVREMLFLRKSNLSFRDSVQADGRLKYRKPDGREALMSREKTDLLRNLSRAFSQPLYDMMEVDRTNLKALGTSVPGYEDIPFQGTVPELKAWLDAKQGDIDAAKRAGIPLPPEQQAALTKAKSSFNRLEEINDLKERELLYVPEKRFGNWAVEVYDSSGEAIGQYQFELHSNRPLKPKDVTRLTDYVKSKYRGQAGIRVTEPFQLTYNNLGALARGSQGNIDILSSLMAARIDGALKWKEGTTEEAKREFFENFAGVDQGALADSITPYIRANGLPKHLLKSKHLDGVSEDVPRIIGSFFNSMAYAMTDAKWNDVVRKVQSELQKRAAKGTDHYKYKRLSDWLDYAVNQSPGIFESSVRTFTFFWGLAGRLSTAILQLGSLGTVLPAHFVKIGISPFRVGNALANSSKYLARTMADQLKYSTGLSNEQGLPWFTEDILKSTYKGFFGARDEDAMNAFVKDALHSTEYLVPANVDEGRTFLDIASQSDFDDRLTKAKYLGRKVGRILQEVAAYPMTIFERAGRVSTFAQVYKALYGNPEAIQNALAQLDSEGFRNFRKFHPKMNDVQAIAASIVSDTFGDPHKGLRTPAVRGSVGATLFNYQNVPLQILQSYTDLLKGNYGVKGVQGALVGLALMTMLGGTDLSTFGMNKLFELFLEIFNDSDTPGEVQIRKALVEMFGNEDLAKFVQKGAFGSVGVGSLSQRMALQPWFENISESVLRAYRQGDAMRLADWTGITGTTLDALIRATNNEMVSGRGDFFSNWGPVMPAAVRDVIRGGKMAFGDGNLTTSRGKPLRPYSDFTIGEAFLTGIGISTDKYLETHLRNRMDQMRNSTNEQIREVYKNKLVNLVLDYKESRDPAVRKKIQGEYALYFEALKKRGVKVTSQMVKAFNKSIGDRVRTLLNPEDEQGLTDSQKQGRDELKGLGYNAK